MLAVTVNVITRNLINIDRISFQIFPTLVTALVTAAGSEGK